METMSPSAGTFRAVVVIAVLCSVLAAVLPAFGFSGLEPNVAPFTEYSTHGALLSPEALYWGAMAAGAASAIGLIGLFFFWSAARFLLLSSGMCQCNETAVDGNLVSHLVVDGIVLRG